MQSLINGKKEIPPGVGLGSAAALGPRTTAAQKQGLIVAAAQKQALDAASGWIQGKAAARAQVAAAAAVVNWRTRGEGLF